MIKCFNLGSVARAIFTCVSKVIAQFRYVNIQLQTIDFSKRLRGINYRVCGGLFPRASW